MAKKRNSYKDEKITLNNILSNLKLDYTTVSSNSIFTNILNDAKSGPLHIRIEREFPIICEKIRNKTIFDSADKKVLKIDFINKINSIVSLEDAIHNIKEDKVVDIINDFIQQPKYDSTGYKEINIRNSNAPLIKLYSVIKFIQDPDDYPIFYPYWKNILENVLRIKNASSNYDSFCDYYRQFPKSDRYECFDAYMKTVGHLLAQGMKANGSQKLKDYVLSKIIPDKGPFIGILDYVFTSQKHKPQTGSGQPVSTSSTLHPLNLILYGPPGTGKTYNTVNKALEIITGKNNHDIDKFNELKKQGRIVFTTFHQSMSYEDFIEGIKPKTVPNGGQQMVTYSVEDGILKDFCYRIIKEHLKKKGTIKQPKKDTDKDIKKKIKEVITSNNFGDGIKEGEELDRYVLIIDEINRGNVSQIFGELITLIEDDKRLGQPEAKAFTVTLPYSNEVFSVPKNLYIIGTMNTADRSVEALDTALRRRFSFEEMMPDYNADGMSTEIEINGYKFKLEEILETINQRIEVLKGREYQIGHSYLMKCRIPEDIKAAFKDKIVPLLQEYFYGDYSQIGLVLGQGFVKTIDKAVFPKNKDFDALVPDQYETKYRILNDAEWNLLDLAEALGYLLNQSKKETQQSQEDTQINKQTDQ